MIRSAGSFGGVPGSRDDAINTVGGMAPKVNPSVASSLSHQSSTGWLMDNRPLEVSKPISQALMGETTNLEPALH